MEQPHYPETESTDPAYNLAFEEYVLTHRLGGDYLLLWQNDSIASHHATTTPVSAAGRATIWKFMPRYRPKGRGAAILWRLYDRMQHSTRHRGTDRLPVPPRGLRCGTGPVQPAGLLWCDHAR